MKTMKSIILCALLAFAGNALRVSAADGLHVADFTIAPGKTLNIPVELLNPDDSDCINMLEVNTTPGMTATSFIPQQVRAAGLEMRDVLTDIVENQF